MANYFQVNVYNVYANATPNADYGYQAQQDFAKPASQTPAQPQLPEISSLAGYNGGHLSSSQVSEILRNSLVLVDALFWLLGENRQFIAYTLVPWLKNLGKKLTADWSTRFELFSIETGKTQDFSVPEAQREAHSAHLMMHDLHARKLMAYGTTQNSDLSSVENIQRIAESNPTKWVVVFTSHGDGFWYNALTERGIRNLLPIEVDARSKTMRIVDCPAICQ